jgi:hypothetical protein
MRSWYGIMNKFKSTYYPDKELIIVCGNGLDEYFYTIDDIGEWLYRYGFEMKAGVFYPYNQDFTVEFIKRGPMIYGY